jgi:hypothetical protein
LRAKRAKEQTLRNRLQPPILGQIVLAPIAIEFPLSPYPQFVVRKPMGKDETLSKERLHRLRLVQCAVYDIVHELQERAPSEHGRLHPLDPKPEQPPPS